MSKICIRINLRGRLMREVVFLFCLLLLSAPSFSQLSLVVNSTADNTDTTPGDGVCDDGSGNCSLRSVIKQAHPIVAMADGLIE